MELTTSLASKFHLPGEFLKEFHCRILKSGFQPKQVEQKGCEENRDDPALISVDLLKVLDWLHENELPRPLEKEACDIPVLLFVPEYSTSHLLFHYDGTPASANLIKKFIDLFRYQISESKATIISPSFIPKSKIKEEQELIQLVSQSTRETSFIKFNFQRIGDFWSYAVKHDCSLLVTTKSYQSDLAKVLFHFYKGSLWSDKLSFYLSM